MSREQRPTPRSYRSGFPTSRWIGVRVRARGFEVDDDILEELRGRIAKTLQGLDEIYVLDLPHSSARNLICLEDELARSRRELVSTELVLTVEDRGYWGEVHFRIA